MKNKSTKQEKIFVSEEEKTINWADLQLEFKKNFGDEIYNSWLKNITLEKEYNDFLILGVPTRFFRDWIVSRYLDKILELVKKYDHELFEILNEIKYYNTNLHLCCILTYGCLLRPHREIRELTWGDFSEDLSSINLSGERNKSGRNRIVPVPMYVRNILIKGDDNHNIFTNTINPMSEDYFKGLWRRFKKRSNKIQSGQTLYSFRHSGAIDVFKRTGSLTKLQEAMGHSSLNVSLTYLRGLEVPQLKEEDMPNIY